MLLCNTAVAECRLTSDLDVILTDAHKLFGFEAIITCYKPGHSTPAYENATDDLKLTFLYDFIHTLIPLMSQEGLTDRDEYLQLGADLCVEYIETFRRRRGTDLENAAPAADLTSLREVVYQFARLENARHMQDEMFDEFQSLLETSSLAPFDPRSGRQWHRGLLCEASRATDTCTATSAQIKSAIRANEDYRGRWIAFSDFNLRCATLARIGTITDPKDIERFFAHAPQTAMTQPEASPHGR
jgi:hypothetical protein